MGGDLVGDFGMATYGLNFRKPARIFAPLGWLAAGILNPAGWFAWMAWGLPAFNYQIWAWHVAVPLELGLVLAMMYFREGGYSVGAVTGLTLICIFAACCGVAPVYSGITWVGQQLGLSLSVMGDWEIYSWDAALAHTGTYVRASLLFSSVAAIPAVIILRLVAFERVRLRKAVAPSPPAPPQDPAV
jgi:hypothetical protein